MKKQKFRIIIDSQNKVMKMISEREIILRKTEITDLESFFIFQLDQDANYLAAFTSKDPTDKTVYLQKYTKLLNDGL